MKLFKAILITIMLSFVIFFVDGLLILPIDISVIVMYPLILLFVLIVLIILMKRVKRLYNTRKMFLMGTLYFFSVVLLGFTTTPISNVLRIYGFKIRIETICDIDHFYDCADSLPQDFFSITDGIIFNHYEIEDLPLCFSKLFRETSTTLPRIVTDNRGTYCLVNLEYRNYILSVIPSRFPKVERADALQDGEFLYFYSFRSSFSWRKGNRDLILGLP